MGRAFLRISARFRAFQPNGGRLGQLVTLGGTIAGGYSGSVARNSGSNSGGSGSIFLPRKAAGDCGQVGGRRPQITADQGFAARLFFFRLCQRET